MQSQTDGAQKQLGTPHHNVRDCWKHRSVADFHVSSVIHIIGEEHEERPYWNLMFWKQDTKPEEDMKYKTCTEQILEDHITVGYKLICLQQSHTTLVTVGYTRFS